MEVSTEEKTHIKKRDTTHFDIYIHKVLKEVHFDKGLNNDSSQTLDKIIHAIGCKIVDAALLCQKSMKMQTLSSRLIQSAVRLVLPGELAKHAVKEGTKAVTKYTGARSGNKSKPITLSTRAGLQFSPSRVERVIIREHGCARRVSVAASVYLAAVLEYLCAEILELAGHAARDNGKIIISVRHLRLVIGNDEELNKLIISNNIHFDGGVIPNIHAKLLKASNK